MRVRRLAVDGAFEFTPDCHRDDRGLFVSPMQEESFVAATGHRFRVAQINHSRSVRDVLRGLHYTATPPGQAKYVHCGHGRALDVVVDLRHGSPTFGACDVVELDTKSFRAVYLPVGVGHAFLSLSEDTVMCYLVTSDYRSELEHAINPLDPELALPWPSGVDFILSERDRTAPSLAEARDRLPRYADCFPFSETLVSP
ncbi:dTDP-4-dehydrorhamnose 3,5-epimerase [Kutzneria viridogrisea]|uniref:dTDP-4-dehydrorhamnose 3,5-epimerase n=1 Tax=Kutzneria viridogrisea TaxID=47990 RepID=A0ABR6BAD3_9PSEU|nr:dTDP-4-dehydrorhamnose 3,5-epimerase [Kutzneria viridogrisea]